MKRLLTGPLLDAGETGPWVAAAELAAAAAFGSARRRAEYLTWRTMVRRELGRCVEITYDAAGAPPWRTVPPFSPFHTVRSGLPSASPTLRVPSMSSPRSATSGVLPTVT